MLWAGFYLRKKTEIARFPIAFRLKMCVLGFVLFFFNTLYSDLNNNNNNNDFIHSYSWKKIQLARNKK